MAKKRRQTRFMTTLSGKYLRPAQRHKRLGSKLEEIYDFGPFCFTTLNHIEYLQEYEHSMTQDDLNYQLDVLWLHLRLLELNIRNILE
ncbi:hypothetical protein ES708_29045 [subsurface metagenome]